MTGNVLMQPSQGGQPQQPAQQGASPEDAMLEEFTKRAAAAGIDLNKEIQGAGDVNTALDRAMRQIWKQQPTDDNVEMIEMLSQKFGIQPPWGQGPEPKAGGAMPGQQMPGGPMQGASPQNMLMAPRR